MQHTVELELQQLPPTSHDSTPVSSVALPLSPWSPVSDRKSRNLKYILHFVPGTHLFSARILALSSSFPQHIDTKCFCATLECPQCYVHTCKEFSRGLQIAELWSNVVLHFFIWFSFPPLTPLQLDFLALMTTL